MMTLMTEKMDRPTRGQQPRVFPTRAKAERYFHQYADLWGEPLEVVRCECCGQWSVSMADHDEGAMVGSECMPCMIQPKDPVG